MSTISNIHVIREIDKLHDWKNVENIPTEWGIKRTVDRCTKCGMWRTLEWSNLINDFDFAWFKLDDYELDETLLFLKSLNCFRNQLNAFFIAFKFLSKQNEAEQNL